MDLSRQEYPALLGSLQPLQASEALNNRVKQISKVTGDVADWLAERRRVEDAYVIGLRRLAANRPDNPTILGVFREPWQSIVGSAESYADSHETFSKKLESDVERPLRDFTGKGKDLAAITTIQGNLTALAKDVDEAQKKSDKLMAKGQRADNSKLSGAMAGLEKEQNQWDSQAPYVFEQLQALDEKRVNRLRDVLTQLQTHEVDQLQRSRGIAEGALNSVLTIDTNEEISTFVAAVTQGAPNLGQRRQSRHSANPSTSSAAQPPATAQPNDSAPPVPDIPQSLALPSSTPRTGDDNRSERSAATSERRSESRGGPPPPTPSTEKKKSGFGGLRRLGTVMGRRSKTETKPPPVAPSPEKKSKSRRNPLRRGSSSRNSMYQLESPGGSGTDLAASTSRQTPGILQDRPVPEERATPDTNGTAATPAAPAANGIASSSAPIQERKHRPPSTIQEEGEHQPSSSAAVAPSSTAVDEITRAQQEAAAVSDDQPQFRLDIKNEPIQEEGSEQAYSNVANTLRLGVQPPPRRSGTQRGRRDVRNTVFVPSNTAIENVIPGASTDTLGPLATSPLARTPDDTRGADTQSIRSSHSLGSMSHGAVKHAEMHEPGLNASIVETISASFSEGKVIRALAIGEVALMHNLSTSNLGGSPTPGSASESIRLENFAVLEKVAPNPVLVTPTPGKNGEYTADTSALSRPQVVFKYQVHLDETTLAAHAPILLTPSWKIEPTQASVILSYAFNPAFKSPSKSVVLANFVLAVHLDTSAGKATSCQSKPAGTFSKEKNLIYWRLGDLALSETHEGPPNRILARFATDGEAKAGNVEARWEILGENAVGCGSGLGVSCAAGAGAGEKEPDPFADGSVEERVEWRECPVQRRIVSGSYTAS